MSFLQEFRTETKILLVVVLAATVLVVGIWSILTFRSWILISLILLSVFLLSLFTIRNYLKLSLISSSLLSLGVCVAFLVSSWIILANIFTWEFFDYHSPFPTQQQESVTDSEQSAINILAWQTYRNEEFGFEIEYPGEWKIEEKSFITPVSRTFGIPIALAYTGPEGFNPLGFVVFGNQNYSTGGDNTMFVRIDALQRLTGYPPYELYEQGVISKHISQYYNPNGESVTLATSFLKEDILFQLEGYAKIYNQQNEELLTQILFTFRFVEDEKPITVLSPNGGEEWKAGETHTITWIDHSVENVIITLSQGSSRSYLIGPQDGIVGALRSFDWEIDATAPYIGRGDLRIVLYDAEACDYIGPDIGGECRKDGIHSDRSDGYFSIE